MVLHRWCCTDGAAQMVLHRWCCTYGAAQMVLHMLANVQQTTIRPIIMTTVAAGALIHTDEFAIYARLERWGYGHKMVCHARGEYARDEDGDGFCEVHVSTI